MQIIKITFGVLILTICVLFTLRFYGLSQQFQAFEHPILSSPRPWILAFGGSSEEAPSHTIAALSDAAKDGFMLAVNVKLNANNHFYAVPQGLELHNQGFARKFHELSDSEVQKINLGDGTSPLELEKILGAFPQVPLFLWIDDNIENIDLRLQPVLKKYGKGQNVLIHSEFDNVVGSIKKLLPEFLYGTGIGQRVRMLMLGSLWLEPIAPADGDFLLSPLSERGVSAVSEALKEEVNRRQKVFILGPLMTQSSVDKALEIGAAGYLTSKPKYLRNKLKALGTGVDLSVPSR
ncbi:MAG: hypothetical protein RJB66_577 [Pseudomonadota bacterium]|jgi:hypothetical protein